MRGVSLDRKAAHPEHQIVAVRADERQPSLEFGGAARGERGAEEIRDAARSGIRRGSVGTLLRVAAADRERPLDLGARDRRRRSPRTRSAIGAASSAARARRASITSVPRLTSLSSQTSRVERASPRMPRALRGLQQSGALLEHAVVVGEHAGEARGALHEQLVGEPPPRRTGRRARSGGLPVRRGRPARAGAARPASPERR